MDQLTLKLKVVVELCINIREHIEMKVFRRPETKKKCDIEKISSLNMYLVRENFFRFDLKSLGSNLKK